MTTSYVPPRVTFIGSDPKIPALRKAATRITRTPWFRRMPDSRPYRRFIGLWQARNRRTRVLMWKVRNANDAR